MTIEAVTLKDFRTLDRNVMPTDEIVEAIEEYFCDYHTIPRESFSLEDIDLEAKLEQVGVSIKGSVRNVKLIKENIKALRKHYGESQEDLALALDISTNAISQYECKTTDRLPEIDVLIMIAEHYGVTLDDLLYSKLEFDHRIDIAINEKDTVLVLLERVLPMCEAAEDDPEEEKSAELIEAFAIHDRMYDNILQRKETASVEELTTLMKTYKKAMKLGSRKAIINHLWWLMYYGIGYMYLTDELLSNKEILLASDAMADDVFKNGGLKKREKYKKSSKGKMEEIQQYFLDTYEELIFVDICLLKRAGLNTWADYYNALRYIFGVIRNDLSREMNCTVGK